MSTTFSYAQAAKGQSATPASNPQAASPAVQADTQVPSSATGASPMPSSTPSNEPVAAESNSTAEQSATVTAPAKFETNGVSITEEQKPASGSSAPKSETESSQQASDRRGRGTASSTRSQDSSDTRKPKKGRKGKAADKDGEIEQDKKEEPQPKIELTEAPVPSVNIWQQRLGEQATKSKPAVPAKTVAPTQASGETTSSKSKVSNGEVEATSNTKHASSGGRTQRKGGDAQRSNDENGPRRGAPRGSRVHDREERSALASISNASSWPTPETAATTEVKVSTASSEKDEKDDASANKTEKKKWIAVPFVPTAKFNTPLPGRTAPRTGRGGSRTSREAQPRGAQAATSGTTGRSQESRSASRPRTETVKAAVSDSATAQDARKVTAAPAEAAKVSSEASATTPRSETTKHSQTNSEAPTTERSTIPRSAESSKGTETAKDNGPTHHRENHGANGASHRSGDRPRGGRGGRGGHNTNGTSHQTQNSYSHNGSGYPFRQNAQQPAAGFSQMGYSGNYQSSGSSANHRGRPNSVSLGRSQANGNSRHTNGRPPHIQPPQAMPYDAQMYPQTALPYDYYSANVLALVQTQIEYYFSVDNLCKDRWLRRNMDSQGYVLLHVITNFRRMKEMTTDYDMIRAACEESREVELVFSDDGLDRVRRATGWESWVIQDMKDREESAQNAGPQNVYRHNRHFYPQFHPQMMHGGYMPVAPAMFSPNGTNMGFMPYMNGHMGYPMANGNGAQAPSHGDSQLSAAVPEFAPSGQSTAPEEAVPEVTKKGGPLPGSYGNDAPAVQSH